MKPQQQQIILNTPTKVSTAPSNQ